MEASRLAGMRMGVSFWWWWFSLLVCSMNGCWCSFENSSIKDIVDHEIEATLDERYLIKGKFYGKENSFKEKEKVVQVMRKAIEEWKGIVDGEVIRWRYESNNEEDGWNVLVLGESPKEPIEVVGGLFESLLKQVELDLHSKQQTFGICCIAADLIYQKPLTLSVHTVGLDVHITQGDPIYLPSITPISENDILPKPTSLLDSKSLEKCSAHLPSACLGSAMYHALDKVKTVARIVPVVDQLQNDDQMRTAVTWDYEHARCDGKVIKVRIVYKEKGRIWVVTGILSKMVHKVSLLLKKQISGENHDHQCTRLPMEAVYEEKGKPTKVVMQIELDPTSP